MIYKVKSLIDKQEYVLKKIAIKHFKSKNSKDYLKEAQILKKIRHNNIIKYYSSFLDGNCLYIVMEFADGGDMQ